jgi:hypothetical protein
VKAEPVGERGRRDGPERHDDRSDELREQRGECIARRGFAALEPAALELLALRLGELVALVGALLPR